MSTNPREDEIRELAERLDDAIEANDMATAMDCFADDCTISAIGRTFRGKENVAQILAWLRDSFAQCNSIIA